jgi:hypothetical protein
LNLATQNREIASINSSVFATVFQGALEVKPQSVGTIQGDQRSHRCQTTIKLLQLLPFLDLIKEHAVSELAQLWRKNADQLLDC